MIGILLHLGAYQWGEALDAWQDFTLWELTSIVLSDWEVVILGSLPVGKSAKCLAGFYTWEHTSEIKRLTVG